MNIQNDTTSRKGKERKGVRREEKDEIEERES